LPDGSDKIIHLSQRGYSLVRSNFNTITIEAEDNDNEEYYSTDWFELDLITQNVSTLSGRPASFEYWRSNVFFVDSPDKEKTVWVDYRDGQQVIILRDKSGTEKILWRGRGINESVSWIGGDMITFRLLENEIADYIISTKAGEALRLGDVTNASTYGQRYY
jgi:hypothetical protein